MNTRDYQRIEEAILFLERNARKQPTLAEVATAVGLSEYHFQRLFSKWAGISPKRFLQCLTLEHAREALHASRTVLDAAWESGLSGPSRLHDLFVTLEAVTPGEFKSHGRGLTIDYGLHPTPFGTTLLAATDRGICTLAFLGPGEEDDAVAALAHDWENATLRHRPEKTAPLVQRIFQPGSGDEPIRILARGTNFQVQVWRALLEIPPGHVATYEDVARRIGRPRAVRAVGGAVGRNAVAYLIPCHRVIRKTGLAGDYRWGAVRKRALLAWEAARETPRDGEVGL